MKKNEKLKNIEIFYLNFNYISAAAFLKENGTKTFGFFQVSSKRLLF